MTAWIRNNPERRLGLGTGTPPWITSIHVVNQVFENPQSTLNPFIALTYYEEAFDSVLTAVVSEALKDQGIKEPYIRLLKTHRECTGGIILHKQGDTFSIRKGEQGDAISPKLFTACLEGVFRKLDWENIGLRISGEYLCHLRFADGTVLLSETAEHMQTMLEEIQ